MTQNSSDYASPFATMQYHEPHTDPSLNPETTVLLADTSAIISNYKILRNFHKKGGEVRIPRSVFEEVLVKDDYTSRDMRKRFSPLDVDEVDADLCDHLTFCGELLPKSKALDSAAERWSSWSEAIYSLACDYPAYVLDAHKCGRYSGKRRYRALFRLMDVAEQHPTLRQLLNERDLAESNYRTELSDLQTPEEDKEHLAESTRKSIVTIWSELLYHLALSRPLEEVKNKMNNRFKPSQADADVLLSAFTTPTTQKQPYVFSRDRDHKHLLQLAQTVSRKPAETYTEQRRKAA